MAARINNKERHWPTIAKVTCWSTLLIEIRQGHYSCYPLYLLMEWYWVICLIVGWSFVLSSRKWQLKFVGLFDSRPLTARTLTGSFRKQNWYGCNKSIPLFPKVDVYACRISWILRWINIALKIILHSQFFMVVGISVFHPQRFWCDSHNHKYMYVLLDLVV